MCVCVCVWGGGGGGGGRFKNTFELLNLRAQKFSIVDKVNIFQCMGQIFAWNFKGTL